MDTRHPFSWGTFSDGFVDALARRVEGLRVLEVFAGNGLLASMLSVRGVDVTATSLLSGHDGHEYGMHHPVETMSAMDAVKAYADRADVLLMSWPPATEAAIAACLEWGPGKPLLYVGEVTDLDRGELGGCASDAFFAMTESVGDLHGYRPRNLLERAQERRVFPGPAARWREGARTIADLVDESGLSWAPRP